MKVCMYKLNSSKIDEFRNLPLNIVIDGFHGTDLPTIVGKSTADMQSSVDEFR